MNHVPPSGWYLVVSSYIYFHYLKISSRSQRGLTEVFSFVIFDNHLDLKIKKGGINMFEMIFGQHDGPGKCIVFKFYADVDHNDLTSAATFLDGVISNASTMKKIKKGTTRCIVDLSSVRIYTSDWLNSLRLIFKKLPGTELIDPRVLLPRPDEDNELLKLGRGQDTCEKCVENYVSLAPCVGCKLNLIDGTIELAHSLVKNPNPYSDEDLDKIRDRFLSQN